MKKQYAFLFSLLLVATGIANAQTDSVAGRSLYFNGFSSYVDTKFTEHLKKFTVEAWVKSPNAPQANQGKGPVHYETNFQFNWDHVANSARGAVVLKDSLGRWHGASFGDLEGNRWYHLAASYDGDTLRAYTNGVLITKNGAPTGPPTRETASLKLGKHAVLSNPQYEFHQGDVDEVRIWDRVLSIEELRASMHLTLKGNEQGLKLYYQLNQFAGDSTLEAVSGRYSAKLIAQPQVNPSTVAVSKGEYFSRKIIGSGVINTIQNDCMMMLDAMDSVTVAFWTLEEPSRGTKVNPNIKSGPHKQLIWCLFDSVAPVTVNQIRILQDTAIIRLTNQYNYKVGLYHRPHWSDGSWTQILDTVTGIAWGSGFMVYNNPAMTSGQFTLAPSRSVTALAHANNSGFNVENHPDKWVLKSKQPFSGALYNSIGQVVWKAKTESIVQEIPKAGLSVGVYTFHDRAGQQPVGVRLLAE